MMGMCAGEGEGKELAGHNGTAVVSGSEGLHYPNPLQCSSRLGSQSDTGVDPEVSRGAVSEEGSKEARWRKVQPSRSRYWEV